MKRSELEKRRTNRCKPHERLLYESCFRSLNDFSEGTCNGPLCGDGWAAGAERNRSVRELNAGKEHAVRSCEDVRKVSLNYDNGTGRRARGVSPNDDRFAPLSDADGSPVLPGPAAAGAGLGLYFSDIEPELVRAIATSVHGGVLPGFPELGRLNPLYVVRNSHISEDINIMMAHHERQLDFLLTEAAHPADRSDLSAARELARRRGVEGRKLPTTHSEYSEKSDSYVSPAGEARLREELRADYELYDLLVEYQEQRTLE